MKEKHNNKRYSGKFNILVVEDISQQQAGVAWDANIFHITKVAVTY